MSGGGPAAAKEGSSGYNDGELIAVFTILITLLLHSLSVKLEKVLKRYKHLSEMLHHLYRELMVLGLISFGLFILETRTSHGASVWSQKSQFELMHIMIFTIAISYTLITGLLMWLSVRISKLWDSYEKQDHADYMAVKIQFEQVRQSFESLNPVFRVLHIPLRMKYFKLVEQISFHDLRLHFLHSNHLQPSFSFARYLRKCKSHVMLQFGDIHTSCWMAMLVILLVDMIQRNSIVPLFTYAQGLSKPFYQTACVVIAAILCLVPWAVLLKARHILAEILCHSEMIDFDPIAARYYIDHWKEDEEEGPERSLSYTYENNGADKPARRPVAHFTAESAVRRVARTFQVDHWGQTSLLPGHDDVVRESSESSEAHPADAPTRLARVQSLHNVEFSQMNLFWFNSHVFMLRMMQVSLFLMVCLISLAIYFSADLLPVNWPPLAMLPIVATPLTVLLLCFSSTVPIYTIIIHVGQLVDLDIVIEARRKGIKKATDDDLSSVVITPTQLRRASTLMLMSRRDRIRMQLSIVMFGGRMQVAICWLILVHVTIMTLIYFPDLAPQAYLPYLTPIIPTLFVIEIIVKLYAAGPKFFKRTVMVAFDITIVMSAFFLSILQLFVTGISPIYTTIVLLRIYQLVRISRIGRIMRHQQEDVIQASIGESQIEMQMQRTKEKIMEAIAAEQRRSRVSVVESEFALRRARSLSQPVQMRSLRLDFEGGTHIQMPVSAISHSDQLSPRS